jgi:nucleoside-diphosphate-sugar epimerase
MKIAITGATGFIGKHLVDRHLLLGDEVRILSRKPRQELKFPASVQVHQGSLLDDTDLVNFLNGVDVLYHCAAEIKDTSKMDAVNIEGTRRLIYAAQNRINHWVQLSSTGVYGTIQQGIVTEEQELNAQNHYEKSKLESDLLVIKAGKDHLLNYTILRPSNVFGADMPNQSLFKLVRTIDTGRFFFIGSDKANANYIHVENVVEALTLVSRGENTNGKIFNLSDVVSLQQFVEYIAENLKKPVPRLRIPHFPMKVLGMIGNMIPKSPFKLSVINALTNRARYSTEYIEKELGYKPLVSIEQGIKELVAAYRNRA